MSEKYSLSLSLNVLNHLGINLYSSIPAVLSEVIANAWDADATTINIKIDTEGKIITIQDDGHGMTSDDLNNKFLHVGYQRRKENPKSPNGRKVMGRKGIGKLSLFSIAKSITVYSIKDGCESGLRLNLDEIQRKIENDSLDEQTTYHPKELNFDKIDLKKGTLIVIKDLKKDITQTVRYLKPRLARRFSILNDFSIKINNRPITFKDREYFSKLECIWSVGSTEVEYSDLADKAEKKVSIESDEINGWIGSFKESKSTKDSGGENINTISIIVRGKVAQEDILSVLGDSGVYATYLIGEIHADFLDLNDEADLATSSRQKLIEDNPRYQKLIKEIKRIIGQIRNDWASYKNEQGTVDARRGNKAIDSWAEKLIGDEKQRAEKLFGTINKLPVEQESDKGEFYIQAVMAFEGLKYKKQLSKLENVTIQELDKFSEIFAAQNEIEASLYYGITSNRLAVLEKFETAVDENAKEKFIQKFLFENLWLLDPMWERATGSEKKEQNIAKNFKKNLSLTDDEKKGRIDITYKTTAGKHIIIELKRPSVAVSVRDIVLQTEKYEKALKKALKAQGENPDIEIICILGKELTDSDKSTEVQLKAFHTKVVFYKQLIEQTRKCYSDYLEKSEEASKLVKFIQELKTQDESV